MPAPEAMMAILLAITGHAGGRRVASELGETAGITTQRTSGSHDQLISLRRREPAPARPPGSPRASAGLAGLRPVRYGAGVSSRALR